MTKRRAAGSLNIPSASRQRRSEVDRQQRQDGAELDQHREGLAEVLVLEAEEALHQQQMPGRGHREEFGQPLHDAEREGLEQVEPHEGHGWLRGVAGADRAGRRPPEHIGRQSR